MLKNQCISVTRLRTATKECLKSLEKEPKYIFINNNPIAVLIDINEYEEYFLKPALVELKDDQIDTYLKTTAAVARKSRKKDLVNI